MPPSKSLAAAAGGEKRPSIVKGLLDEAGVRLPKYKKQIDVIAPYIVQAADAVDNAYPYAVRAYRGAENLWKKAQPYHPQQYFPLIFGLVICFFGGSYLTLIAAVETVRLVVWERLYAAVLLLYKNYCIAAAESRKDDEVDEDGNGIADVNEISDRELFTRKVYLFARTVDPHQVSDAVAKLWTGILSIVATLRVHFAQAVTLGCSIAEIAEGHFAASTLPVVDKALPNDLKKWAPVANSFIYRFTAVVLAWFLKRVIAGFHAAIRGAHMFVTSAIILGKENGMVAADFDENSPKASVAAGAIALLGFYWQLSNGFGIPFPLNLPLLPVTILEWVLTLCVGVSAL